MESGTYKLSASLKGHEDDVRDVAFFASDSIVSVSRDATVRLWSRNATDRSTFDDHVNSTGTAFVNSVAHIEPTPEHPKGLIVSAGQDTMIDIREPGSTNPDPSYLLIGHAHNVCTLDTFGDLIVSGSWDGTARVWKNFQELYTLRGHESAVWAVLALSESLIVTAGADKTIRLWENGKGVKRIVAHTDCVRGLCRLPNGMFASCANDATIRVWDAEGNQVQELYGHTNYIYSVSALPTGEIVSCGEDRTLRVWRDGNCIQTITHPALSVWSVGVDHKTGDLVTGASDNVVRVFSRDPKKWATEEALKEFEDSVAKSSIPATQVGDIEKDKLPGLEALASPGKKDGQVIMVRNGSNVEAHMWSASAGEWANVGQVVDAVGSNRRRMYEGAEYDFVFDVDIQEGAPPLKLPYNASQNPFEAARKFLENNELPMDYLDTVGNFIVQNSKGVSLDQTTQEPAGPVADPFGIESRYRPGEVNSPSPPPAAHPKVIPQKDYLTISTANLATVEKKTLEINANLVQAGKNDIAFSESESAALAKLCKYLNQSNSPTPLGDECVEFLQKFAVAWSPKERLPILDLLRLAAGVSPKVAQMDLVKLFVTSESWSKEFPNNIMLAVRAFVNLFQTKEGCKYMGDRYEEILSAVRSATSGTSNRNLKVAEATLLLNYSVLFVAEKSGDKAMTLLEQIISVANTEIDAETMYRNLVTLGTLLTLGGEMKQAAALYEVRTALKSAVSRVKDPRFPRLVAEIEKLL
ncbi:Similar to Ubiquitin homeostasis protein lub1; acc. no. O94289 [Pyronema omphalodes CBS 100304]|uniref:Similar to Ubiquitin homeostasis protein lub1 acc. no. O94289 n=1 Tax=Pyronema omphalodes (strain CBS 100304) TaxID=1076935 RepID=U4KWT9_PYROM|nr:Similar to Ubiquitin homeostasis protein lub1; acc. no. O94289 [Pyronema omphalodes CBS 100304]